MMVLRLTPKDIIERGLWTEYAYYILKDLNAEAKDSLIRKNEEFELSERDAFVIGLFKVIYTVNLVHKFNNFIIDAMAMKSFADQGTASKRLMSKQALVDVVDSFMKKFPPAYEPDVEWREAIKEVSEYITELRTKMEKLPTVNVQGWPCINIAGVKKLLTFHMQSES